MVFVPLPGDIPWTTFRDVFEVDGSPIRDREARLERLFLQPDHDSVAQANEILRESARHNLGGGYRTVNVPTLALLFFHPRNQNRFSFELKGTRFFDGIRGVEIEFREKQIPTLVRDRLGNDVPARGRAWVDPVRGTVLRSEAQYDLSSEAVRASSGVRETASISTLFQRETALDAHVPIEMKELYLFSQGRIEATARYSNFRRFSVDTEEVFAPAGGLRPEKPQPR
jgi:hypothetical protein